MANTLKSYVPALGTDYANADIGGKGAAGSPSFLEIISNNGTAAYIFAADDGTLRTSTTVPTSNTSGSALVGTIGAGAVLLANLGTGITPSHIVVYAGKITWTGGGATLASTVTGVASTDIVIATLQAKGTQTVYLVSAAPTTNTITFTLSTANTSNDTVVSYEVLRAAS